MRLIDSTRKDNIFYGDIFIINQMGSLIFGHGKSNVCRSYTGENTQEIALDMACLTKDSSKLYGHFEMEMRAEGVKDPIEDKVEVTYFIRMLNEEETKANKVSKAIEISLSDFIDACEFNITFALSSAMMPTRNMEKLDFFKNLTEGKALKCYVIPWCNTPEERGKLVSACIG